MCFPVTLWVEKLSCLSNRVWLGCDDAVRALGERGRAVALGGGLTFLITEPRREGKAGEKVGFCPASCLLLYISENLNPRFCLSV